MSEETPLVFIEFVKAIGRIFIVFRIFTQPGFYRVVMHVINFLARYFAIIQGSGIGSSFPKVIFPIPLSADVIVKFGWVLINKVELYLLGSVL